MKKRKILVLFPLLGLLLTGCDFKEVMSNVKSWISENIYHPVKDFIDGKTGEDEKEKEDEGGKEEEKTVKRIVVESYPEQVAQNGTIDPSNVQVRVYYSDNTDEVKAAESVSIDTSVPGDNIPMTVTYGGKTDTVTVKVVDASEVVHVEQITVESRYVNDMHVGDTYTIQVSVLPDNATNQSVTFASENEQLATVTANGVVTALAAGVVKVNVVSVDNPQATNWVQFTISEVAAGLPGSTKAGYTKLAATETLKNGEKVNFAGAIGDKYYAMPNYTSGNNIKAKEVSTEDGKLVIEDIVEEETTYTHEFTVVDNGDNTYSFAQANGKYLSAAGGSSSNYLKVVDSINDTAKFKVAVDANGNTTLVAEKVTRGSLCFNPNSGTPIFACYAELKYEAYALYHDGKGSTEHVAVESLSFGKTEYSMEQGDSIELSVSVLPATATNKQYTLEIQSANPEGCISLSGNTVTGEKVGSAVIIAKSNENDQITATTTINVTEKIERNYGSLESPLSIAEAKALIDLDGGTAKEVMYVKGEVSKNDAYNTSYKNTNIWLKDGADEFELYGAKLPEGFEPAHPAKNDPALVGKIVVAHGMGKIYGSTYEFDKNCQVDSVKDNDAPVESVTLDRNELNLVVGMPDETLVATVLPANAGNKKVIWESSNPEVATVNEGVVHAVAAGDAIITVKSDADNEKTASCTVHVTKPEKKLTSIEVTTMPKVEYTEGDLLDLSGMVVTLHYDDQSTAEITSGWTTNIAADHELTTEDTSLIVSYGGFSADPIALTITAKPQPTHAGTAADPYTGEDAVIVANNLAAGGVTDDSYYVKGVVVNFEENFNPSYGNYSFKIEGGFIGWRLLNGEGKAKFNTGDLEIGDTVTMYVQIQSYIKNAGDTPKPESKNGYIVSIEKPYIDVESVSLDKDELNLVVGMPDETLVATVSPEKATNKAVEWESSNPEVATVNEGVVHAVAAGDATITVKSVANNEKTASCTVHVTKPEKKLTSIEVTTMPKVAYTEGDLLDLSGMVVTLHYDDQSTAEITSGWTTNIAEDQPLTLNDTTLIVSYGGFSAEAITLTISEKVAPQPIVQPGTYWIQHGEYFMSTETGSNGQPLATNDSNKALQLDFVLEEGTTDQYKIKVHDGSDYLYVINNNNGIRLGSTAAVWTVKSGLEGKPGAWTLSAKDASDNERFLTMYNTTDFRSYTSESTNRNFNTDLITPFVKTLESISVEGPTKVNYEVGELLNTEGLVVKAHYTWEAGSEDIVLASSEYTISQEGAFTENDIGDKTITVSFGGKSADFVVHISEATTPPSEKTTINFDMKTYASDNKISSQTKVSSIQLDSVVTATASGTDANTGRVYVGSSYTEWRFYGSGKGALTISLAEGYVLDSVTIGKATSNYGAPTDFALTVSNNEAVYSPGSNFNVKTIVVVYHAA